VPPGWHLKLYSQGLNLQSELVIENVSRIQPVQSSSASCRQTALALDLEAVILRAQENPPLGQRLEGNPDQ